MLKIYSKIEREESHSAVKRSEPGYSLDLHSDHVLLLPPAQVVHDDNVDDNLLPQAGDQYI